MHTIDHLRPILDRVRTDITAIKAPDGASIWKRDQPLTSERIQAHLDGKQLRGVCPIKEGESTTRLALLDLDSHKGETAWDDMLEAAQLLYDTLKPHGVYFDGFVSSGGKGIHLVAIWDEPQDAYSVRKLLTDAMAEIGYKNGTGGVAKKEVEVFPKQDHVPMGGCGNQFILPYSPKGEPLAEPEWRLSEPVPLSEKPMPKPKARPVFQADNPKGEAAEALSYVPNDDYWLWVEMAMALSDEFGSEGFEIWDSWSSGSPKYNGKEMWRKWQSFRNEGITIATLFDQARLNGWRPEPIIRPEADTSLADAFAEKFTDKSRVIHAEEKAEPKPAPARKAKDKEFDPLKLEGLIGDTVRWICSDAMFPMPTLALLHVLAWAGAVFGRRYASPINTRTNLYLVGVANTATGKNHSRVKLPLLAREAGLVEFGGAHGVISDTGVARSLYDRPSQVLMLDEWGLVLQSISDKKAPSHNKKIKTLLMALYSQSGSSYSHGDYANKKLNESITIENPNLCVYGTTTEKEYVKALSKDAVESGELNRVMAIKADPVPRRRVHHFAEPPEDLIDGWARFSQGEYSLSTATNGSVPVTPKIVGWGDCDELQWNLALEQDAMMHSGDISAPLWGRRHENIIKIAMIFAIARNKEVPEMRESDFDVAVHLVDKSIHYMTSLIGDRLPETDYEGAIIEVQDFIRKAGDAGVTRTKLCTRFRKYKSREMDDIITSLLNQDMIIAERSESKTRASAVYRYAPT
jgi:hypothetical protein